MVFTEQGVAMLSGVLKSKRAILVNIQIIRVFVRMRALIESQKEKTVNPLALKQNRNSIFVPV